MASKRIKKVPARNHAPIWKLREKAFLALKKVMASWRVSFLTQRSLTGNFLLLSIEKRIVELDYVIRHVEAIRNEARSRPELLKPLQAYSTDLLAARLALGQLRDGIGVHLDRLIPEVTSDISE